MPNTATTGPSGDDSTQQSANTPTSNLPTLPLLDDDLPTLSTSTTLSRLTPLNLALRSSLATPTPSSPDITAQPSETARDLQHLRRLLATRPSPYHVLTPQQLEAKTFKWLVLDLTYQETLEREIERLDILCDEQILSALYQAPMAYKKINQEDIEKRKKVYRKRVEKSVEEGAVEKARGLKVEPEGWDDDEAEQKWLENNITANIGLESG